MNQIVRSISLLVLGAVAIGAVACGDDNDDDGSVLEGGILATFVVTGEQFNVWITNSETIDQVLALQAGDSMANIPNGRLLEGPGQGNHNAPWSWHLDPEEISMAEITIELCDGAPSYIEEHLDEFIETVGQYCPWSAELIEVEDYR